ncbi:50S ribosomal protein L21 [Mycoplasmopsis bovirhinis]|nr:50S ribosomal protein L21 [Mycoplasmopsis bovirhinis]
MSLPFSNYPLIAVILIRVYGWRWPSFLLWVDFALWRYTIIFFALPCFSITPVTEAFFTKGEPTFELLSVTTRSTLSNFTSDPSCPSIFSIKIVCPSLTRSCFPPVSIIANMQYLH